MKRILLCLFIMIANVTIANEKVDYLSEGKESLDNEEKIEFFKKAIEDDSANFEAYYLLGRTLIDEKQYELAIKELNHCIELNPNYYDAYVQRGYSKGIIEDVVGREADYLKAIEIEPSKYWPYYALGYEYESQEKFEQARSYYSKALQLNHSDKKTIEGRERATSSYLREKWVDSYKEQLRKSDELQENAFKQQKRHENLLDYSEKNQERFEKILDTWEQQQKQYQKYLDSLKN